MIHIADEAARPNPGGARKIRWCADRSSPCRCSRKTGWSAPSSSTARKFGRSPTSRSIWCRTSPRKPSSPSRTRGCSTNCGNRWSSRRLPRKCYRSSVRRPAIWQPVFQSMLENATRICEAKFGSLLSFDGKMFEFAAEVGTPPEFGKFMRQRARVFPGAGQPSRTRIADEASEPHGRLCRRSRRCSAGQIRRRRSTVDVPMLKDGALAGVISIYRQEVRPFTDKQIALLTEFRRPGRHRRREHAAAQRIAAIAGAADRHGRRAARHQFVARRA